MSPVAAVEDATSEETSPAEAQLETIKARFKERVVALKQIGDAYGTYEFVFTSPSDAEWDRYQDALTEAGSSSQKKKTAVVNASLAQIRFPERDEVKAILSRRPGLYVNFPEILNELAGVGAAVIEKKQ